MRGNNQDSVQRMNRFLVVRIVSSLGVCSRATIAKASGLQQATITYIAADLLEQGILRETGKMEGGAHRKSIGLEINPEAFRVLGIRLTRRHFYMGVFNLAGELCCDVVAENTVSQDPARVMKRIVANCLELRRKHGDILAVGVSLPGPFLKTEGRIMLMSESPGWEKVYIQDTLAKHLDIPVVLAHDANAGVVAEWWFGSHRAPQNTIVYIAAGQGIGSGILIDGKVLEGQQGIAGEIGHMSICFDGPRCICGNRGCLELYCSTIALQKMVHNYVGQYPTTSLSTQSTIPEISAAVGDGDPLALDMYRRVAEFLGVGVVNIVNLYNPDVIIVGDELSKYPHILLPILDERLRQGVAESIYEKVKVEVSTLSMDPAFHGAGAVAVQYLLQNGAKIVRHPGGGAES